MTKELRVEITEPEVRLPNSITIGRHTYRIDFLTHIVKLLQRGNSVVTAYEETVAELKIDKDLSIIPCLTNSLRSKFKIRILDFPSLTQQKIENTMCQIQQVELVRQLRKDRWREVAILKKVNELFPGLKPLTQSDLLKISNYWPPRKKQKKALVKQKDTALVARSLKKDKEDSYKVVIEGPLLRYQESVSLTRAKSLLNLILTGE